MRMCSFDYLASNALLNEASEDAELIYAGKRSEHHHVSGRDSGNFIGEGFEGKMVVRLKGGDPFISAVVVRKRLS
ncbi:MAG: hypothetical protein ACLSFZ_01015 [Frisingicoccus sp.]